MLGPTGQPAGETVFSHCKPSTWTGTLLNMHFWHISNIAPYS